MRLTPAEYGVLIAATTLTGKGPAALLRETFLMANNHMLLPDLVGTATLRCGHESRH